MIEMPKQRLERIAAQILAGLCANGSLPAVTTTVIRQSVEAAAELIRQIDERSMQSCLDYTRKGE